MDSARSDKLQLRKLVDHIADGIVVLDEDFKIKYLNEAALAMFGRKEDELVGTIFGFPLIEGDRVEVSIVRPKAQDVLVTEMRDVVVEWDHSFSHVVSMHDISERVLLEKAQQQHLLQANKMLEQTIKTMSLLIEKRDPYTAGHQIRVSHLSTKIAELLGLPDDQVTGIRLGSMIHDIGKVSIPTEILNFPGQFNSMQRVLIQSHAEVGHSIVKGIDFPWDVQSIVRDHHEYLDGSGYPRGLKGDKISVEARIVCVADIVEAMSSHRPYRTAFPISAALDYIRSVQGKKLDVDVVNVCIELFEVHGYQFPKASYQH